MPMKRSVKVASASKRLWTVVDANNIPRQDEHGRIQIYVTKKLANLERFGCAVLPVSLIIHTKITTTRSKSGEK